MTSEDNATQGWGNAVYGCPCLYTEPCNPRCTCRMPTSSVGCSRCCRYGNIEQRRKAAEYLAALQRPGREASERTDMEVLAANVHQAYLDTCQVLGWSVKPENAVPYEELDDRSKELDRASVRAVLAAIGTREAALVAALSEAVKGLENIADYTNALTWKTAKGLAGYAEAVLVAHRLRDALISPPGLSKGV